MNKVLLQMRKNIPQIQTKSQFPSLWELLATLHRPQTHSTSRMCSVTEPNITIKFADDRERARKVVRRSNYRMTGKYPSAKCNSMIQWESPNELKSFHILEVCPWVQSYREQPAEIQYADAQGVNRTHYPDIFVEMVSGRRGFMEIKPDSAVGDVDLMQRTSLLARSLNAQGHFYLLVFQQQIESGHYLENARKLLRHIRSSMPPWEKARKICTTAGSMSVADLISRLNHSDARKWVYRLVISGKLACDLSLPFTNDTRIHWNDTKGA